MEGEDIIIQRWAELQLGDLRMACRAGADLLAQPKYQAGHPIDGDLQPAVRSVGQQVARARMIHPHHQSLPMTSQRDASQLGQRARAKDVPYQTTRMDEGIGQRVVR